MRSPRLGCSALALLASASLSGCCCTRQAPVGSGHAAPPADQLILQVPPVVAATADTIIEAAMHNVLFHVDDDIRMHIRQLRGRAEDLAGEHLLVLDDKHRIRLDMAYGEIALGTGDLTRLLNRYVFGYPGSPLKDLVVRTAGDRIVQTGVMHKVVDIPFRMTAELSVTEEGLIRIHPVSIEICSIDGGGFMRALGIDLSDLLDLSGAKGARVDGNDLLLSPLEILPPPRITGRLTAIGVEGDEIVQVFGEPDAPGSATLVPPTGAANYIFFRGGTIRFGKLYMVQADLEAVDGDPSDAFDFYLDYYHTQLVAGYHTTLPDYGLSAVMPDYDDLGTPKGRVSPGGAPR